jgi:nudix-type nucleoside diphosphatase (YffH/AdpP family)
MPIEIRNVETVFEGYSTIMTATVAAADGSTYKREIEHHGHAVAVLPYDPGRRLALLVRQPRLPVIWAGGPPELDEAPAGMLDEDDPETAARREALEEAGVRLKALEPVGTTYSSAGVSSERVTLFLAPYGAEDRVEEGGGLDEEHEDITVLELPLADLWARVERRDIADMKTLLLTMALRVRRPELFQD